MNKKVLTWLTDNNAPDYVMSEFKSELSIEDMKKQIKDKALQSLKDKLKEWFIKYPEITEFSWNQYTPYFNDGDACYFYTHFDELLYLQMVEEEGMSYEEFDDKWGNAESELYDILRQLEDEIYLWLFDDHITVTCIFSKDEVAFETNECDHD